MCAFVSFEDNFSFVFYCDPILVNVISLPALHRATMETMECDAGPGIMWPIRARTGSCGRPRRRHQCVGMTLFPSSSVALICFAGFSALVVCASVIRKWRVARESRMAHFLCCLWLM